jgi:hypothetical protein
MANRDRLRYLVSQGAEPRLRLAEPEGKVAQNLHLLHSLHKPAFPLTAMALEEQEEQGFEGIPQVGARQEGQDGRE